MGVVVVGVEAVGVGDAVPLKVEDAACDGSTWAQEGVVGGAVCNALTFHRILLVRERERDLGHAVDVVVIQRCDDGSVHAAAHGDRDVADAESLGEQCARERGVVTATPTVQQRMSVAFATTSNEDVPMHRQPHQHLHQRRLQHPRHRDQKDSLQLQL